MQGDKLGLERFAPYIRREAGLRWATWGLAAGLGLALVLALLAWLTPIGLQVQALRHTPRLILSLGLVAAPTLLTFLGAYLYPRSPLAIARTSDVRLHLRDRLATAVEIEAGVVSVPAEIVARQRADARAAAADTDPRQAFSPRLTRLPAAVAAVFLALLIASLAVPNPQEARIARMEAERAAIEAQVERLEALREAISADERLNPADREALEHELERTLQEMREEQVSAEEAMARLSAAEDRLRQLSAEQALSDTKAKDLASALRQAGQEAAREERTEGIGQALNEGDYEGAAREMASLDAADEAGRARTAERLEAMADAIAESDPELAQALRDAASAMREGDAAAAREAMSRAAERMRQAGEQIAAQEATGQALGQIQEGQRQIAQVAGLAGGQEEGQGPPPANEQTTGSSGQGTGSGSGRGEAGKPGGGTPGAPQGPIAPNGPGRAGETEYEPIYVPERLGNEGGEQVSLPGQDDGTDWSLLPGGERLPPEAGRALVPYREVYAEYQEQALRALENSYVPRGVQEYVRMYFGEMGKPGE